MSAFDGSVDKTWAGDERSFRLGIAELLALQERRDSGPLEILNRLRVGTWRIEDVQEVLRLGLIGAGVEGRAARKLIDENVVAGRVMEAADIAFDVLWPAMQAPEPVGKKRNGGNADGEHRLSAAALFGNGAVLGFTPAQVGRMTVFQFAAAIDGYNASQGGDEAIEFPTDEEFASAKEAHGDT